MRSYVSVRVRVCMRFCVIAYVPACFCIGVGERFWPDAWLRGTEELSPLDLPINAASFATSQIIRISP